MHRIYNFNVHHHLQYNETSERTMKYIAIQNIANLNKELLKLEAIGTSLFVDLAGKNFQILSMANKNENWS